MRGEYITHLNDGKIVDHSKFLMISVENFDLVEMMDMFWNVSQYVIIAGTCIFD